MDVNAETCRAGKFAGVDSTLGARVMPWALRSAAIISRRMAFLILVPDMGHWVTNRT